MRTKDKMAVLRMGTAHVGVARMVKGRRGIHLRIWDYRLIAEEWEYEK